MKGMCVGLIATLWSVACGPEPPMGGHPQYPSFDLGELPGHRGGAIGPYEPPTAPVTTREVTITSTGEQAARDILAACQDDGTAVEVPAAVGALEVLNLGDVRGCDVRFDPAVRMHMLVIGSLVGPVHAPVTRLRIRGGQIGSLTVMGGSSDLIFDSVTINNGIQEPARRDGTGIYMPLGGSPAKPVRRMVVVNSFIRMVPVPHESGSTQGIGMLGSRMENILFANNNIVTAGNMNSWAFRLSGASNFLIVDNTVRVSFHKLVRMNTEPVDYVFISGGTWIRQDTAGVDGQRPNDSFQQLSGSTTNNVFVRDTAVYSLPMTMMGFGMTRDAVQSGLRWEARRIQFFARDQSVISEERMERLATSECPDGATCDYGADTHTYTYDPALRAPSNPWRDLPAFADDDPDNLPTLP